MAELDEEFLDFNKENLAPVLDRRVSRDYGSPPVKLTRRPLLEVKRESGSIGSESPVASGSTLTSSMDEGIDGLTNSMKSCTMDEKPRMETRTVAEKPTMVHNVAATPMSRPTVQPKKKLVIFRDSDTNSRPSAKPGSETDRVALRPRELDFGAHTPREPKEPKENSANDLSHKCNALRTLSPDLAKTQPLKAQPAMSKAATQAKAQSASPAGPIASKSDHRPLARPPLSISARRANAAATAKRIVLMR